MREFSAKLLCQERHEGQVRVELDASCFYPEGGGQPADRGTLNGVAVVDVQKADGRIWHWLEGELSGQTVEGVIDWDHRYDYMQQHTGQHLISAALVRVSRLATVSVHFGEAYTTIEVGEPSVAPDQIRAVEQMVNAWIREDGQVRPRWIHDSQLDGERLRRPTRRKGRLRLVEIPGLDCVACGGVHVARIAEVGWVKCIGVERIRGHARTIWKIGNRAFEDYTLKHEVTRQLAADLSSPVAEIPAAFSKQLDELRDCRRKNREVSERLASALVTSWMKDAEDVDGVPLIIRRDLANEPPGMRLLLESFSRQQDGLLCLEGQGAKGWQWGIACGKNRVFPVGEWIRELLPIISGRGGGKAPIWQGSMGAPDALPAFHDALRSRLREHLSHHFGN